MDVYVVLQTQGWTSTWHRTIKLFLFIWFDVVSLNVLKCCGGWVVGTPVCLTSGTIRLGDNPINPLSNIGYKHVNQPGLNGCVLRKYWRLVIHLYRLVQKYSVLTTEKVISLKQIG